VHKYAEICDYAEPMIYTQSCDDIQSLKIHNHLHTFTFCRTYFLACSCFCVSSSFRLEPQPAKTTYKHAMLLSASKREATR